MTALLDRLDFVRGPGMKNRFVLAPLTNTQSHEDGTLSDEEFRWLTMRAEGGFGLTMTCAAHVQAGGQGFPGQLAIFDDRHMAGHTRLASEIKRFGSLAVCQLHHAGLRSPADLIGETPVAPSDHEKSGARGLSAEEIRQLIEDFVAAAVRCERAGYDGVEIHGAHSYIICQFLSDKYNRRSDEYGGSLENRSRLLREIVAGVRARCREDFMLGVRLSGERFGIRLQDTVDVATELMASGQIDFLDMSLWDVFKEPEEPQMQGKTAAGLLHRARKARCSARYRREDPYAAGSGARPGQRGRLDHAGQGSHSQSRLSTSLRSGSGISAGTITGYAGIPGRGGSVAEVRGVPQQLGRLRRLRPTVHKDSSISEGAAVYEVRSLEELR